MGFYPFLLEPSIGARNFWVWWVRVSGLSSPGVLVLVPYLLSTGGLFGVTPGRSLDSGTILSVDSVRRGV